MPKLPFKKLKRVLTAYGNQHIAYDKMFVSKTHAVDLHAQTKHQLLEQVVPTDPDVEPRTMVSGFQDEETLKRAVDIVILQNAATIAQYIPNAIKAAEARLQQDIEDGIKSEKSKPYFFLKRVVGDTSSIGPQTGYACSPYTNRIYEFQTMETRLVFKPNPDMPANMEIRTVFPDGASKTMKKTHADITPLMKQTKRYTNSKSALERASLLERCYTDSRTHIDFKKTTRPRINPRDKSDKTEKINELTITAKGGMNSQLVLKLVENENGELETPLLIKKDTRTGRISEHKIDFESRDWKELSTKKWPDAAHVLARCMKLHEDTSDELEKERIDKLNLSFNSEQMSQNEANKAPHP